MRLQGLECFVLNIDEASKLPQVFGRKTTLPRETNKLKSQEKENKIMARKPMVTRTILTTKANVLCMDINSCEPFNKTVVLPRVYKDEQKLLKAIKETVETETIKAVHVVDSTTVETLYGLEEEKFFSIAVELDKETRKPVDEEETEE